MGQDVVRGMACDHWVATNNTPGSNLTLHWYFSAVSWTMPGAVASQPMPVMLQLLGSRETVNRTTNESSVHSFDHTYSFVGFYPNETHFHNSSVFTVRETTTKKKKKERKKK